MVTDHREKYISGLEADIKKREREIKKLEPQVAPLQEEVTRCYDAMEAVDAFQKSCRADFHSAVFERSQVTDRIDDHKRFLKRDNDLLNSALRRRREEEKKAERRAKREAKKTGEEPRFYDHM